MLRKKWKWNNVKCFVKNTKGRQRMEDKSRKK